MFFNKPINELSFNDIVAFLKQGIAENTMLDYKFMLPKNNEKFAKTIAAFANTMGGTIILGVKDENDKPIPPFNGQAFHTKIRPQIESIIQNYIDPVVFVDIATCKNPKNNNMYVVINIPQSNLTPHLVGDLKRAYIRTGQASRPEVIVHPDKLPWLLDNRKKSQSLRHILLDKAQAHFNNFLIAQNLKTSQLSAAFTLIPLYPQTPAINYKDLPKLLEKIKMKNFDLDPSLNTIQDGLIVKKGAFSTIELNSYGLISYRTLLNPKDTGVDIKALFKDIVLFFKLASNFYKQLGFISPLLERVLITNARGALVKTAKETKQIAEDFIRLDKNIDPLTLHNDLAKTCASLIEELAWSLNIPFTEEDAALKAVLKILDENN
ncbi:MAG: ATP-binding protein [Elusimicrobiaceae bacterium]|nr:ATP-binding protein [Elusimicrobiaceae bacterium]MBQ6224359.1 ATP-binding protein [Campylobacter sp.]